MSCYWTEGANRFDPARTDPHTCSVIEENPDWKSGSVDVRVSAGRTKTWFPCVYLMSTQ